jgi:hypothetical protein
VAFTGADFRGTRSQPVNFCRQILQRGLAEAYEKCVKYRKDFIYLFIYLFIAFSTTVAAPILMK